jgi:YD repeat-containing protein
MKIIYDKESDTLSIILRDGTVAVSDEAREGLILDYDKAGRLVSIEMLDASEAVRQPESVEFALAVEPAPALLKEKPGERRWIITSTKTPR